MRIFRKERQPRANTRALASFAGRLVEVVLTIIDLVVEGAPETDDAARGSQQQERAARTGQRLGAHSISRASQAPSWRRLPQRAQRRPCHPNPGSLHSRHCCACSTSAQTRTKPRPVAVRVSGSWRCASSVAPQHCPNCSAPALDEGMHCEWNSACKSRQFVRHNVGSSWDLPAPTLKLLTRDFTQLWATRIWCRHRCRAALYLSTVTCTRTVARRCVRLC